MKKYIFIVILGILFTATAQSAPLTPQEALSRALNEQASKGMRMPAAKMELVRTISQPTAGIAALYVFANKQGGGYLIAAADDSCPVVLGYSSDAFDADNMPEAMEWWLGQYASQIEAAVSQGSPLRIREEWESVAPLLSTRWSQGNPYNLLTPVVNGKQTPTGCVATAMAQVMNYYQYPTNCVGQKSYVFSYMGTPYSIDYVFDGLGLDWANMLSVYADANSNSKQNEAISTLMYACGVASQMTYGPKGSGTNAWLAGRGLVDNFLYSPDLRELKRNWFTAEEWNQIVYAELTAGRPVLYTGVDSSTAGHAFVCDGYDQGYFHINWGWGGTSDGYYVLSVLNPPEQGIGGGSGKDGYNFEQGIIANLRPADGGSAAISPVMELGRNLKTGASHYDREEGTRITFQSAFTNLAIDEVEYELGIKLDPIGAETEPVCISSHKCSLLMWASAGSMHFYANSIPEGSWVASPVYRKADADENWQEMYYNIYETNSTLRLDVTESEINVSDYMPSTKTQVKGRLISWAPLGHSSRGISRGGDYRFTFELTVNNVWQGQVVGAIIDKSQSEIKYATQAYLVDFEASGKKQVNVDIHVPEDLAVGEYRFALLTASQTEPVDLGGLILKVTDDPIFSGIESADMHIDQPEYYNLQGIKVTNLTPGVYIVRRGKETKKIIIRNE